MRIPEGALRSLYDSRLEDCWYHISSYYSLRYKHHEMLLHTHTAAEFMYVRDGSCGIRLSDERIIPLCEGEYIFLDSMVPHELMVEKGTPCHVLNLEISLVRKNQPFTLSHLKQHKDFRLFLEAAPPMFFRKDMEGVLGSHLVNLLRLIRQGNMAEETGHQMMLILFELGRQFVETKQRKESTVPTHVKRALAYISENFDRDLTIDEIARVVAVSRGYLQRSFHEAVGCTMVTKINELRISKAKILLGISTLPVVEVAVNVGYNSRQHFSASFARATGLSPAQYRKQKGRWLVE